MHSRRFSAVVALVLVAGLVGCTGFVRGFRHGATRSEREGRMLRADSPAGSRALEIEAAYDRGIRTYVEDKGAPDYVAVISRDLVTLIYVERDEVAAFQRPPRSSRSTVKVLAPINDHGLRLLETEDRDAVLARRAAALPPDPALADPGAPTVSGVAKSCHEIELSENDGKRCAVGYSESDTFLWIDFGYPQDEAFGSAPDLARRFCAATNASGRRGFVRFRVEARERAYACELARWGEWVEADASGADSPL
jgi:hypothetical protein